jgi:uncharacterized protein YjaG (DUF416 family)
MTLEKQNQEKEYFFTVVALLCEAYVPNDPLFCLVCIKIRTSIILNTNSYKLYAHLGNTSF